MSDWVWSHVFCLKRDRKVFEDAGYTGEVLDEGETWVDLVAEQTPYGNHDFFQGLTGKGAPFLAWSAGLVGSFSASLYTCDGDRELDSLSDDAEYPVVQIMNDGNPNADQLVLAREFVLMANRVREMLGIKEKGGGTGE